MRWRIVVKWLLIILAVAIIAGTGYYGYTYFTKEEQLAAIPQMTTNVTRGDLSVRVSGTSSIEPLSKTVVKTTVNGKIEEVLVADGDVVKKGDVIVRLAGDDISSQIRSKSLTIQKAEIDLKQLQENYITADDTNRESLLFNIQKQQLELELAREELSELQEDQGANEILAPIDGTILSLSVEVGSTINTNAEIAQITNYEQLKITVPVDELDISKVALGQTSTILVEAFEQETFTGVVTEIAREGKTSNGVATFDVTVKLDDPKEIKSGMSAEASILVEQKKDVLMLPIDAVQSTRNNYYVLVNRSSSTLTDEGDRVQVPMRENPFGEQRQMPTGDNFLGRDQSNVDSASSTTRVSVEVGIANEDYIEIVSGLNEGDIVILPTTTTRTTTQTGFPGSAIPGVGGGFNIPGGVPGSGGGGMPRGGR